MKKEYIETEEKTILNERTYTLYKDETSSCKYIKIHGLFYPAETTEWQEHFHHTYKTKLAFTAVGLCALTSIAGGSFLVNSGLENLTSDVSIDYYDLMSISIGLYCLINGAAIAMTLARGDYPL